MKKALALVLALVLALGVTTTAFAVGNNDSGVSYTDGSSAITSSKNSATIQITSIINVPTIDLTVGDVGTVILNPYKLDYKVETTISEIITTGTYNDAVIAAPTLIKNKSNVDIKVSAVPTVSGNGATCCVGYGTLTGKQALIALHLMGKDEDSSKFGSVSNPDPTGLDALAWQGTDGVAFAKQTYTAPATSDNTLAAEAVLLAKTPADTITSTPEKYGYGAFKICGDCSTDAASAWTTGDGITIQIVFTFSPNVA